jgi:hypothetical protein
MLAGSAAAATATRHQRCPAATQERSTHSRAESRRS